MIKKIVIEVVRFENEIVISEKKNWNNYFKKESMDDHTKDSNIPVRITHHSNNNEEHLSKLSWMHQWTVSYCISRMYEDCILVDAIVAHYAISLCSFGLA